ncbi:probable polygalacturonase isoform X1 [Abrus precatorius]|uniref:Probable polygalacturonase isoform X1 n=1 Tax=Abrus precatorius TaxID=3816 RepID=A0A8B8K3V2_ABRPR|nr:probable polygalacturonase isoform X1 [Abrus precatorius]
MEMEILVQHAFSSTLASAYHNATPYEPLSSLPSPSSPPFPSLIKSKSIFHIVHHYYYYYHSPSLQWNPTKQPSLPSSKESAPDPHGLSCFSSSLSSPFSPFSFLPAPFSPFGSSPPRYHRHIRPPAPVSSAMFRRGRLSCPSRTSAASATAKLPIRHRFGRRFGTCSVSRIVDPKEWPIIEPLPSYGRGRERLGGRHISLIHGNGLSNVVITGQNGTVDGQGKIWWELWWNRTLEHTRGHLLELMNSDNVLISNLTFRNSPFWTIHPVYCSNVLIKGMTILAPLNAPNTDGIDPDSSTNVCIEDNYIESGDDLVAIKSGWDQYGITMARPSTNIIVRRVSGTTPTCSGVGIGSEMSGGISNIKIENLHVWDSAAGVRIKSDKGRGGYITNVSISDIRMERVKIPIRFSRGSNDHPDDGWDPQAVPRFKDILFSNVVSVNSTKAPVLEGIEGSSFEGLCFKNITLLGVALSPTWHCEYVSGFATEVLPVPCHELQNNTDSSWCSR